MAVEAGDTEQRLWGMEIDVGAAAAEVRSIGKADEGKSIDDFLGGIGLGAAQRPAARCVSGAVISMDLSCIVSLFGCACGG